MRQKVVANTLIRDGDYCLQKGAVDTLDYEQAMTYKVAGWVRFEGEAMAERSSVDSSLAIDDVTQGHRAKHVGGE